MAIADRNLIPGTRLWARYKGAVHTAEVVAHADDKGNETVAYRLSDGREFKSPSAAGAAIMGPNRTCNGWAFWTVGEPVEKTAKEPTVSRSSSVNAAPKPERKGRKAKTVTEQVPTDGNGHALPIVEQVTGKYECGNCGQSFDTTEEATAHISEVHPA